jgi:hypothetical protein
MTNKQFNSLSKSRKRVAIAKDVIAQLTVGKFKATPGTWYFATAKAENIKKLSVQSDEEDRTLPWQCKVPLQKAMCKIASCQVCGVGAIFASLVRLNNEFDQKFDIVGNNATAEIAKEDFHEKLIQYFDEDQLNLIELAFEKGSGYKYWDVDWNGNSNDDEDNLSKDEWANRNFAVMFGFNFSNSKQRLIAIMKNIIKNDGTFAPTVSVS